MMQFIEHRKNSIDDLKSVAKEGGVEMDLRSNIRKPFELLTGHDAFKPIDLFLPWLETYKTLGINGPLLINTKEDGLEEYVIEQCKKMGIENYYFLDTTIPTLVKYSQTPQAHRFMPRLSQFEPLEGVMNFKGKMNWLWVDSFSGKCLPAGTIEEASKHFKLCLVSPELQGFDLDSHISEFTTTLSWISAICTKDAQAWKEMI